jgi:DNA-binding IscR family transcriptional regulator
LSKKPEDITVGEVVRVTEGDISPVLCVNPESSTQPCERSGECVTQVVWNEAGKRLKEYFDSVTIKDLCNLAGEIGIKKDLDKRFMYYI